ALDARVRIARHEALHVAAHVVEPDRVDGRDTDRPVHARLHRRHPRLRLLPRLEEAPTRLVEGLTLRRDDEWALRPVHERHAELRLEQLDRLARRRLRPARRPPKASTIHGTSTTPAASGSSSTSRAGSRTRSSARGSWSSSTCCTAARAAASPTRATAPASCCRCPTGSCGASAGA